MLTWQFSVPNLWSLKEYDIIVKFLTSQKFALLITILIDRRANRGEMRTTLNCANFGSNLMIIIWSHNCCKNKQYVVNTTNKIMWDE